MNLRKFLIPKKVELIFEMRLFKADFQTHFLMSRKPFSQFNVCEKLESGKLLQFIVFQTFDSKLFFLKLNYGSRTREGNENIRDQSSCQISGNLGLCTLLIYQTV